MKKLSILLATTLLVLTGCSNGGSETTDKNTTGCDTLKVFNWGELIGDGVIQQFEEEYGVKVIYDLFDSNETMYTKLKSGDAYDVLVPSDYMIERLIKEDMLQPIDKDVVTNIANVNEDLLDLPYDPGNEYSVPYFYGTVGIIYNGAEVDSAKVEEEGFGIFQDPEYAGEVFMYDSERDAFMIALKDLGYSMNTENEDEIAEAYEWLLEMDNAVDPVYVTDEVIDSMINEVKQIALGYSGDAAYMMSENPNLEFYLPESGTNLFVDALVIPENAPCPALANEFINFMASEEIAFANSDYVGYSSPIVSVSEELSSTTYDGINAYTPRTDFEKDESFTDNEVIKKLLSDYWVKVKAN